MEDDASSHESCMAIEDGYRSKKDGLHAFQLTFSLGSGLLEMPSCIYVEPALISERQLSGVPLQSWLCWYNGE